MINLNYKIIFIFICLFLLSPIFFIVFTAITNTSDIFEHLIQTVLLKYFLNTFILMLGVGSLSLIFGISTSWIIARYSFWGRGFLEWALLLPAAIPAYIVAYSYTDFLDYSGPIQTLMREIFGWQNSSDYWFPEIRSFWIAIIIMSSALYPYIYLLTKTSFKNTSKFLYESTIITGKNIFFDAALPLARPAIIAGLALVLMEVVSDFGTVEYFALETLTLGIFNVWLGMNDISAAAQLSIFAFLLIGILISIEIFSRSRKLFNNIESSDLGVPKIILNKRKKLLVIFICLIPISIGFLFPSFILLNFIFKGYSYQSLVSIYQLINNSFFISFMSALCILILSFIIAVIAKFKFGKLGHLIGYLSSIGYAFPGIILAIGVLGFTNFLDNKLFHIFDNFTLGNTIIVLLIGLIVRFQAVGFGSISSGINSLPPFLMDSGRILGKKFEFVLIKVIFPLLRPSLLVGFLLIFVDVMKELPMTLLLRPFSFETFATFTYQYAKDELLEEAAIPAFLIIIAGLIPVIIAHRTLQKK